MPKKSEPEDDMVVIKKYANRRLYNTALSSYVTLDHLAKMVRDGEDFVVRDAKSGEDITRSVLTQIIFEEEAKGQNMLPTNFLRQLIRLYGDTLQGFVPSYLDASMEAFTKNQEQIRSNMRSAMQANPALANFEAMTSRNMEWFENTMRMFTPFGPQSQEQDPAPGEAPEPPEQSAGDVELESMKQKLETMQEQLEKLVKKS